MRRAVYFALGGLVLAACYMGSGTPGTQDTGGGGGPGSEAGLVKPAGLPCAVSDLVSKYCLACHGVNSSSGTSLLSLADFKKTAKSDSSKNEAQLALARMQAGTMPPQGSTSPSAPEIAVFASWVGSGLPAGTCASPDGGGPDPFGGPHVCSSGTYYQGGESPVMEPGNPCISCHAGNGEAPRYSIAGTVYSTGHEPARCRATGVSGAQVAITDKNNQVYLYAVNSVGNFSGRDAIALPYRAEVRYAGKVRAMAAAQQSGDCNACHTENGTNGAPGRILLPQ